MPSLRAGNIMMEYLKPLVCTRATSETDLVRLRLGSFTDFHTYLRQKRCSNSNKSDTKITHSVFTIKSEGGFSTSSANILNSSSSDSC